MKHIIKNQNQIKSIVVGGGFGGISIHLLLKSKVHDYRQEVNEKFGSPRTYICELEAGARVMSPS